MSECISARQPVSPDTVPARILLVDDEPTFLEMTTELLELRGHTVFSFTRPAEAVSRTAAERLRPDVLVADMQMPGMDGLELIRQIRDKDPDIVAVIATAHSHVENAIDTIRAGAFDFISKPFAVETFELVIDRAVKHRQVLVENRKYQETMMELVEKRGAALRETTRLLEKSYQFMLESMVALVEAREPQTGEHTKRVMEMSVILARHMGLGKAECETIRRGASLHDVGKIAIPDRILLKAGPLDPDEWEIMKSHVEIGYNLLSSNSYLEKVAELVHSHHEHFDGNGYPRGLRGDQICLGARIFSVVDAYDAIRSTRPYSASCSAPDALREIVRCSGKQFDPQVVACMERHHRDVEQAWWKGATENDRKSTRDLTSPIDT
ncbi:MAG TPA: HD domain-containing phosphohydrolase [Oceanipulchritudo sp.]|nr:HD domain-containing phosphohydrolase [Oceanipulchritudo sp.]